jgi:hypothetical protein
LCFLVITACAGCSKQGFARSPRVTMSLIPKTGVLIDNRMEGQPVVFKGALYYVVSNRNNAAEIEIYNQSGDLISHHEQGTDLLSAIVVNDELFVFSTRERKSIVMIKTSDLVSWTAETDVLRAPQGSNYFNTSVAKTDSGFLMAYETCETGTVCFNVRFAESTNLIDWHEVAQIYSPNKYAACPTIRFLNGTYYMFYLITVNYEGTDYYDTVAVKSTDLVNWSEPITILQAEGDEDRNNSDFDFVEFNGEVLGNYADGNQHGGQVKIRGIKFKGSEDEFYNSIFK